MNDLQFLGKIIIQLGIILVVVGFLLTAGVNVFGWFGNLPGDIRIDRDGFTLYFPLTSMILLSLVLNLILRIFSFIK
ncbi:MAG: DUF2905 domain-containing protein [Bacillota bacterium]